MRKPKTESTRLRTSSFVEEMGLPVDPQTFVFISNVFHAAARLQMVTDNPSANPIVHDQGKAYAFTDTPFNRGMLAARKELEELKIYPAHSYLSRLMHLGELLEEKQKFAEFFEPGTDGPDSVMVSEALIMAGAVATFETSADRIGFDLDDVLVHARRFVEEDKAKLSRDPVLPNRLK